MDRQREKTLELPENSGHSAQKLVRAIGSPRNAVTEWKAGQSKSYRKYAPEIAQFFGVDQAGWRLRIKMRKIAALWGGVGQAVPEVILYFQIGKCLRQVLCVR